MAATVIIVALLATVVNTASYHSDTPEGRWVDLTHAFDKETTLAYPGLNPFIMRVTDYKYPEGGYWLQMEEYCSATHVGTHMDAPCHIVKGQWTLEDIPIDRFVAPAAVVDIRYKTSRDRDANLEVYDLIAWEERTNKTLDGTIVLVNTGWSEKWCNKKEFLGTESNDVEEIHFPGVAPSAAEWIVQNRNIYGLGIDTTSLDNGQAVHRKAHEALFRANVYGLENVKMYSMLPSYGAKLYVFPMRMRGTCGAPARILALIPPDKFYH